MDEFFRTLIMIAVCTLLVIVTICINENTVQKSIKGLDVRLDNIQTELKTIGNNYCATWGNVDTHYNHIKKQCVEVK